jgi:hypothetical protein
MADDVACAVRTDIRPNRAHGARYTCHKEF